MRERGLSGVVYQMKRVLEIHFFSVLRPLSAFLPRFPGAPCLRGLVRVYLAVSEVRSYVGLNSLVRLSLLCVQQLCPPV